MHKCHPIAEVSPHSVPMGGGDHPSIPLKQVHPSAYGNLSSRWRMQKNGLTLDSVLLSEFLIFTSTTSLKHSHADSSMQMTCLGPQRRCFTKLEKTVPKLFPVPLQSAKAEQKLNLTHSTAKRVDIVLLVALVNAPSEIDLSIKTVKCLDICIT